MISDICPPLPLPPVLLLSVAPSLVFLSVCFQCQFCCVSVSHGSFWPTHGQTHSKPVQLISILRTTFPELTKLCLTIHTHVRARTPYAHVMWFCALMQVLPLALHLSIIWMPNCLC